jgi:hypothetical protein
MELGNALDQGLVKVDTEVLDVDSARLSCHVTNPLVLNVPAGTFITSGVPKVRSFIVTSPRTVNAATGTVVQLVVPVASLSMLLDSPTPRLPMKVKPRPPSAIAGVGWESLARLLASPGFQALDWPQQQFAVWVVADDPAKADEFLRIKITPVSDRSAAVTHDPDLPKIREVLQAAGLDPLQFSVFKPPIGGETEAGQGARKERVLEARKQYFEVEKAFSERSGPEPVEATATQKRLREAYDKLEAAEQQLARAAEAARNESAKVVAEARGAGAVVADARTYAAKQTLALEGAVREAMDKADAAWKRLTNDLQTVTLPRK